MRRLRCVPAPHEEGQRNKGTAARKEPPGGEEGCTNNAEKSSVKEWSARNACDNMTPVRDDVPYWFTSVIVLPVHPFGGTK